MIHKIEVIGYYTDGGDGGGGFSVYNNIDELQEKYGFSDEKIQAIVDEDDPYGNGEITGVTIEIEEVDGKFKLAKDFYLHWGQ